MAETSFSSSAVRKFRKSLTIRLRPPPTLGGSGALTARIEGYFNAAFLPCPPEPDRLQLICRKAYYGLDARGFMVGHASPDVALNGRVVLGYRDAAQAPADISPAPEFDGLEDIRFFASGEQVFLFAIGFEADGASHRPVPVIGRLRSTDRGPAVIRRTATEAVSGVEKNWVFFERDGRLLIEKFPGMSEIYEVDRDSLELRHARTGSAPFTWSGTKAAAFDGGHLFLDHRRFYLLRRFRTVQRYAFRFRHISGDGRKTRYSPAFSLGPDAAMVYASDMCIDAGRDQVLIAASENDAAFAIYGVSAESVRRLLR